MSAAEKMGTASGCGGGVPTDALGSSSIEQRWVWVKDMRVLSTTILVPFL